MKRRISWILIIATLLSMMPIYATATEQSEEPEKKEIATESRSTYGLDLVPAKGFANGKGTKADPYIIATEEEFAYFENNRQSISDGRYFSLANNLDFSVYSNASQVLKFQDYCFYGDFNGNGYRITLHDDNSSNSCLAYGMFGCNLGTIKNLYVTVSSMVFRGQFNGVIAGENNGLIENVHVTVEESITINYAQSGKNQYYGGIAGRNSEGDIKNCSFEGLIVTGNANNFAKPYAQYVGGIAGYGGTISTCVAEHADSLTMLKITNENECPFYTGGIVGSAYIVENCYSRGDIRVSSDINKYTGGIAGSFASISSGYIKNCWSWTSTLAGGQYTGGIIGFANSYVYNCYTEMDWIYAQTNGKDEGYAGYIAAACANDQKSYIVNCYGQEANQLRRTAWYDDTSCDNNDEWRDSQGTSPHENSTAGTVGYTLSESFLKNTLGWGFYKSYSDTLNNPANVWTYHNITGTDLETIYSLLTIRYIDESGKVFRVDSYTFDYDQRYSIQSPEKYGAAPDKTVVSGTFTGSEKIDVKYNHQHVSESKATCVNAETCALCGFEMNPKIPHTDVVSKVVSPTCEEDGYTIYTCSACGYVHNDRYVARLGHQLDNGYTCTRCGKQFPVPLKDFTVYVYDAETTIPVEKALVSIGDQSTRTDATGAAYFQLDPDTAAVLKITKDEYPDYENKEFTLGDMPSTYIYIASDESGIYEAWCNSDNVLLIESQINSNSPILEAKIVIAGRAKANIKEYEIVQDNQVIATSTDGKFIIPNPYFKEGVPVYARMRTDGTSGNNVFERELNISVVDFSFKLELSDLFPFSAGLNFDFTDGVPLLNGVEFQMPAYALGEDGIFNVTALNEKVLITFGMEKDYFDDGMDNKSIQEIWKAAKKKIKENSLDMNKKKSEVTITGALALEFGKEAQVTKAYAECHVGYEWSHKWGKTFVVWVIPVYVGFKTSFEGEVVVTELGWDFENAELLVPDVDLTLAAEFAVYGGIGCALVSAGVYGAVGGEIKTGIKDFEEYFRYKLYGEMGLYARIDLIFFKELEYRLPLLHGEFTGPKGQVKKAILSPENYQTASRSYLENRSQWMEGPLVPKRGKDATRTLQTSSYTAIEPRIVVSGDTVMMLFLDDDGSEGFNYQHLYYSLFNKDTNTWGKPMRVDDSAFADLEYDVYGDDSGIYIAYTKAGNITEENQDDYAAIMATTEVYTARYDLANNCFIEHTNVSQNNSFDSQPQICNGTVIWVNNFTNDVYSQNANNVLMIAQKTGSTWQNSALDDHGATVTSIDLGVLEGKTYIALIRDVDCDLLTAVDRRLELMDLDGNVTVVTSTSGNEIMEEMYDEDGEKYYLSEGDLSIEAVRFDCIDGQNVIQWCGDENIWQLSAVNGTPVSLLEEPEQGLTGEFKMVRIDEDKTMILYAKNSVEDQIAGSSIYAVYYADGQWGKPVALTETTPEVYVDAFDGCSHDGKLLMAYISTQATITEENITRTSNFMTSCLTIKDDLAAGEVVLMENELFEGSTIELNVPVTNLSWQKLHNVTVQVVDSKGTAVYTQSVKLESPLGSGQTEYLTVTLPKDGLTSAERYSVYVTTPDWSDGYEANNRSLLALWYTDFEVAAQQMLHAGKQQINYAVTNSGNTAGTGTLWIYKKVGDDKVSLHEEKVSLAVGKTHTAMVEITDKFYTDGTDGVVYVEIKPDVNEVYNFNNSQSLSLTTVKKTTTDPVPENQQAIPAPMVDKPYVIYDKHDGGNISASVTENGWSFTGVKELDKSQYSYSGSKLTLKQDFLNSLPVGYHYYTLSYSLNGKTSDLRLILEIRNSGPAPAPLTVQDVIVTYDGAPVELSELGYTTPSGGAVTTRYSTENGWLNGTPTEMGEYTVELTVAEDAENNLGAVTAQFKLTVIKGTRAISVPTQIKEENGRICFGGAIPTAAAGDGKIYYGYSTQNNAETVSQWSEAGVLPQADKPTMYYVFAKITGGTKYGDAVSKGYAVDAHIHQYEEKVVPPTTAAEGYTLHTCKTCGTSYKDNFVEKLKYIRGDVNDDGYVNSNDVLYFLRFTLSPGRYPINQSGDMNGDGYVNSNDVLYLLRHILSPGRYPLHE